MPFFQNYDIIMTMEKINGTFIRKKREEAGYSLREFAEMIYTSKSSLLRWEQTFAPSSCAPELAQALGMSVEELCAEAEAFENSAPQERPKQPEVREAPVPPHAKKSSASSLWCSPPFSSLCSDSSLSRF